MSRIGRQPVQIPSGVTVSLSSQEISFAGPKGQLKLAIPADVKVVQEAENLVVSSKLGNMHGLVRSLIANSVTGVSVGWTKSLELSGTGFRASTNGSELNLALGFSHPIVLKAPAGVSFQVVENKISVMGIDKAVVGEIAAQIRAFRPADPYKAKGLKYEGEVIVRKAGKAAKAGATK